MDQKVFLKRGHFEDRTPRSCRRCLKPAQHLVMKSNQKGEPNKSSAVPICDGCAGAAA